MSALSRRTLLAAALAVFAASAAPAFAQATAFSSVAVDVSRLRAIGAGPAASLVQAAMTDELQRVFADRIVGRGPRLVVRVTALFITAFPGGRPQSNGATDLDRRRGARGRPTGPGSGGLSATWPPPARPWTGTTKGGGRGGVALLRAMAAAEDQLTVWASSMGTSGSSLTRSRVSAVRTLRTLGRAVRSETRPWNAEVRGDAFWRMKSMSPDSSSIRAPSPSPSPVSRRQTVPSGPGRKLDHREAYDLIAERLGVEECPIALDDPGRLEGPHPPEARRRGKPDPAGQLDIRDAAIGLQLFQNGPVYGIKASAHGSSGDGFGLSRPWR